MTRTSDGAPDPVTDVVRAADLRARAPQSAIPTQGGPPLLPPPRSGPPPMGPMIGPPSGPARRSPLISPQGRPTPQHPSGEQPPLDDEVSVPLKVRLAAQRRRARELAKTPAGEHQATDEQKTDRERGERPGGAWATRRRTRRDGQRLGHGIPTEPVRSAPHHDQSQAPQPLRLRRRSAAARLPVTRHPIGA